MKMRFLKYLFSISISLFSLESANAGKSKAVLWGLELFEGKALSRFMIANDKSSRHSIFFRKTFFSTTSKDNSQLEKEGITEKIKKKTLHIVDVGKKDYKFDPKTSMYYYEDKGSKELKDIKKLELKVFDTFIQFNVKK